MTFVLDDSLRADFQADGDWPILVRHQVRWSEVGMELKPDAVGPVLAKIEVEYHKPLHYRDEVLIGARVVSFRTSSLVMRYATWARGKGLVNKASALCVMFINTTGEKAAVPETAKRIWRDRHGAKES